MLDATSSSDSEKKEKEKALDFHQHKLYRFEDIFDAALIRGSSLDHAIKIDMLEGMSHCKYEPGTDARKSSIDTTFIMDKIGKSFKKSMTSFDGSKTNLVR